jgi:hypothetical protein
MSPAIANDASGLTALAVTRLTRAMGHARGTQCAHEALTQLGLAELTTPSDLLDFANCLLQKGGLVEVVGTALKIAAILRGARPR